MMVGRKNIKSSNRMKFLLAGLSSSYVLNRHVFEYPTAIVPEKPFYQELADKKRKSSFKKTK